VASLRGGFAFKLSGFHQSGPSPNDERCGFRRCIKLIKSVINYYRCSKAYAYSGRCEHTKVYRAEDLEARVWNLVLSLLRDPERLRVALDNLIEEERLRGHNGDPERETQVWLKKIAETDRIRGRFYSGTHKG
jgi:hypothetical protein